MAGSTGETSWLEPDCLALDIRVEYGSGEAPMNTESEAGALAVVDQVGSGLHTPAMNAFTRLPSRGTALGRAVSPFSAEILAKLVICGEAATNLWRKWPTETEATIKNVVEKGGESGVTVGGSFREESISVPLKFDSQAAKKSFRQYEVGELKYDLQRELNKIRLAKQSAHADESSEDDQDDIDKMFAKFEQNVMPKISEWKVKLTTASNKQDWAEKARCHGRIASLYKEMHNYEKETEHYKWQLEILKQLGDEMGQKTAQENLGKSYLFRGEYKVAMEYYGAQFDLAKKAKDKAGEGEACGNLGKCYKSLGEYSKAKENFDMQYKIGSEIGDVESMKTAEDNLELLSHSMGHHD